jgi:Ca-activated chloride channel family protein
MRRILSAAVVMFAAATLAAQQTVIPIRVEIISVPVTVLEGRANKFVQGLKQNDFELLEDGVPQEITSFAFTDSAVDAVLLIDTSGSMTARLTETKRAATEFIRQMGPNDVTKIAQFDDKLTVLSDFSPNKEQLALGVTKATIGGQTTLRNAVWTALADLRRRPQNDASGQRHRAVVLVTDGEDTSSAVTEEEVMSDARRADALVYSLSLERRDGFPVTDSQSAIFLQGLADQTGGRVFFPTISDLPKLYRQLSDELRHQYVLGYVPSSTSARGRWRAITVRVKNRNNLKLRHRLGYFSDTARSSP